MRGLGPRIHFLAKEDGLPGQAGYDDRFNVSGSAKASVWHLLEPLS
jgi:hypothetical protein